MVRAEIQFVVAVALLIMSSTFVDAQTNTHSNGFNGKSVFFQKGDANVKVVELDHAIGSRYAHNGQTAELIKVESQASSQTGMAEFAYYTYTTPKAPVTAQLSARVFIKTFRPGVQLRARVVLPKHRDPKNPNAPLTAIIVGETSDTTHKWQALSLGDPVDALKKVRPVLTAELKQEVNTENAYIDQLILNVYPGPGVMEIWIDDLEIGPCESTTAAIVLPSDSMAEQRTGNAKPASLSREGAAIRDTLQNKKTSGSGMEFVDGQFLENGKPFFIKAIRLSDTDPYILANCQFNTIWLPSDVRNEQIDEVVRHGFKIVPTLPLPSSTNASASFASNPKNQLEGQLAKDADAIATALQKYQNREAVLMWNLGGGRTFDEVARVRRASDLIDQFDPKKPRGADLWDGYEAYSNYLDTIGTHRWPLFTSLEMLQYRDWLRQRKALTGSDKLMLSWVQTHLPDWYVSLAGLPRDAKSFNAPIGPHPEQLRLLTYLSIASGSRGIGYWSDRYLADSHHGRDRLLELCLLNAEIKMIEPILAADHGQTTWIDTNHPNVKAAVITTQQHTLVLPIWQGPGSQYCPDLSAVGNLKIRVPNVSDSSEPWLLNPCDVINLKTHGNAKSVPGGTEITIPEFDLTACIVFTNDTSKMLVEWQDYTRHISGERSARWATTLAAVEFNKTKELHDSLANVAPPVSSANALFEESRKSLRTAEKYLDNGQANMAYREARKAMRPLRMVLHDHWKNAVAGLDLPVSSPFAISVFTLQKHWDLANQLKGATLQPNVLKHGTFDLSAAAPPQGAAINSLPGWVKTTDAIDPVLPEAAFVNAPAKNGNGPNLGSHVLQLSMQPKQLKDQPGKIVGAPIALERAYVAVDSSAIKLQPGTIVRISFWANVPQLIQSSADGAMVYEDSTGEALAVRLMQTQGWKKFHLYRIVPASGQIVLRFALTGIGVAQFDDVKIEPMLTK